MMSFRLATDKVAAVEAWAARQPDKPSRSEALRRLVDLGMEAAERPATRRKRD